MDGEWWSNARMEEVKKNSRGMRESGVVGRKEVEEYVNYWRGIL